MIAPTSLLSAASDRDYLIGNRCGFLFDFSERLNTGVFPPLDGFLVVVAVRSDRDHKVSMPEPFRDISNVHTSIEPLDRSRMAQRMGSRMMGELFTKEGFSIGEQFVDLFPPLRVGFGNVETLLKPVAAIIEQKWKLSKHFNHVRINRNGATLSGFLLHESSEPSSITCIADQFSFAKFRSVGNPHACFTHQSDEGRKPLCVERSRVGLECLQISFVLVKLEADFFRIVVRIIGGFFLKA